MFYLISGTDIEKVSKKINELLKDFSGKQERLSIFRFDEDNFSEEDFSGLLGASGLFFSQSAVVSRGLFSDKRSAPFLSENLGKIKDSENIFVFIDKKFEEKEKSDASGFWDFGGEAPSAVPKFAYFGPNLFRIADALFSGRKNEAWILSQEEMLKGMPAEEIFWKIVFKIKILSAIKKGETKGMNKYAYDKSKKAADHFDVDRLRRMSFSLVDLYHKNNKGLADLSCGLEKFILSF
ncbi:MAG: hypothetical protein PHC85_02215 [Candidatus Pacebacteria bacterium]|nr:hypothetical protein [Candidatus Paceibacterota bacterium]